MFYELPEELKDLATTYTDICDAVDKLKRARAAMQSLSGYAAKLGQEDFVNGCGQVAESLGMAVSVIEKLPL